MLVKQRIIAITLILVTVVAGYFAYASEMYEDSRFARFPFKMGLDLAGGTHLVYSADISTLPSTEINDSLDSLRDVIERRINIFGVSEPRVQVERRKENNLPVGRLIIELPGITDVDEATRLIGATPVLEFRIENPDFNLDDVVADEHGNVTLNGDIVTPDDFYISSGLSGKHLQRAQLDFHHVTGEPFVSLVFDKEGSKLFADITTDNVGKTIAIYLDGSPIQTPAPVVQEAITGGQAQMTGTYTADEAKQLVGRLNSGALPIPITLLSTQSVGASLGEEAVERGVFAGIIGIILVAIFFLAWYRLPGLLAVVSLTFYLSLMFSLFKLIPVTLTSAGVAGFILSIGLAVDANVLIFERLKEELREKDKIYEAIENAFSRAWPSIRDANVSSLLTAIILFWFGSSLIKGFALTFGIGVLVSMFSAITFTKALLMSLNLKKSSVLLHSGFKK